MKKYILIVLACIPICAFCQGLGIGIKAGLNFANVSKAADINNSSKTGFHAGLFLAPQSKGIIGSRTELIFSRQGYDYKTSTNTGTVDLNYIMLPQYMSINITKYFSLMFGAQMAFLLNANVDSSKTTGSGMPAGYDKLMSMYNRFDYGYGGGIEIHPVSGLVLGARINISLGNLYKQPEPGQTPSFYPKVDVKNNVFQAYAGWVFGKKEKKEKKNKNNDQ